MKKVLITIFTLMLCFLSLLNSGYTAELRDYINISGFDDYPPFGYSRQEGNKTVWHSVMEVIVDNMTKEISKKVNYKTYHQNDATIAEAIANGEIDLFLSAYNQTNRFDKLAMFYPSVFSNPITFFVLPSRMAYIKTTEDLSKLKGVRYSGEIFTDFIENKLSDWNVEKVDSIYEVFEKIFTKQADYFLSSYYFGFIEAVKLGVSRQIAFSKTPLWNIPVFVGVAMKSPYNGAISYHITRYFEDEKVINEIKTRLQKIIEEFETEYSGAVPPAFNVE